jgi:hypothetical protein
MNKKRFILFLVLAVIIAGSVFAVEFDPLSFPPAISAGSVMIDAGAGWWITGYDGKFKIPPLFVNAEFALPAGVPISVGAGVGFFQWTLDVPFFDGSLTQITPWARGTWHWGLDIKGLDLYSGVSLGYSIVKVTWKDSIYGGILGGMMPDVASSEFYWGIYAGARYFFTENIGVVIEPGYPFVIKGGLALKFGGQNAGRASSASRSSSSSSRSSGSARSSGSQQAGRYMIVNADALNVRKGPSADYDLAGQLTRNTRVEVLERSGQWWRIRSGNIDGYVNSSYLIEDN